MYFCIIVDDQTEALDLITDHVSKIPSMEVSFKSTDSIEALSYLDKKKPDIIFLDIEMPGVTGIEFTESIKAKWGNDMPKIVFTTGHTDYALTGFEKGVADYLLKPITFSRFKQCTDRILDELNKRVIQNNNPDFAFIDDGGKKLKLEFHKLVFIEAAGNYITLCMNGTKKTIYKSLNGLHEILPAHRFCRVHKSYMIAIDKVVSVKGNEVTVLHNQSERTLPVGVTYKENLYRLLGVNK